jgi:hypothetical protein
MLAYVFWHRPKPEVDVGAYEDAQHSFHALLEIRSASFRVAELPFGDRRSAYEDWYLVRDWADLGELNETAGWFGGGPSAYVVHPEAHQAEVVSTFRITPRKE